MTIVEYLNTRTNEYIFSNYCDQSYVSELFYIYCRLTWPRVFHGKIDNSVLYYSPWIYEKYTFVQNVC